MAQDVKNQHLERGSRHALVGLFGEGWVHQEFASKYIDDFYFSEDDYSD
jgi:hypothetical protein